VAGNLSLEAAMLVLWVLYKLDLFHGRVSLCDGCREYEW
jgi:hypothetical protein